MARKIKNRHMEGGFIWFRKGKNVASDIKIDGTSVKFDYLTAEFTRSISPEIGSFKIQLINSDGKYSDKYGGGETVQLYVDFADGDTLVFEGKIDSVKNRRQAFEVLEVSGGHLSSELLDITVTKEYLGTKSCDTILKEIIDEYISGYTYDDVETSDVSPNIKWSNKPFWNCVEDLCKLAVDNGEITTTLKRYDCWVDDDKDFHFFKENSQENSTDAIVWNDTLLVLEGYGEASTLTKNKILVYGDDGTGLPIISTSSDSDSQDDFGIKEAVITDTDIVTMSMADELGSASLILDKTPETTGKAHCFMLPTIRPGEKIWVSDPSMNITQKMKMMKYTHTFPMERTNVVFTKDRNVPTLFRERILKDMAQDDIINPYEMTSSINWTFDDYTGIASRDSNVAVSDGVIKLTSGTTGEFTSSIYIQDNNISQVHLKVVGEQLTTTIFKVSTDGGTTYETINRDVLSNITAGKRLVLKVQINAAATTIDSIALLIK